MITKATEQALIELHRGHGCETWTLLVEDSIKAAINRTTYREWVQRYGLIQFIPGGHEFPLDEDGKTLAKMDAGDRCTYLQPCARCDDSWCIYCEPNRAETEVCPG
jgi:hypothetical protein